MLRIDSYGLRGDDASHMPRTDFLVRLCVF